MIFITGPEYFNSTLLQPFSDKFYFPLPLRGRQYEFGTEVLVDILHFKLKKN